MLLSLPVRRTLYKKNKRDMVAPYNTGVLVSSVVRVTGSGSNRAAKPEYLDLGRASSLAASVAIPKSLPSVLAAPKVTKNNLSVNKKLNNHIGLSAGILPAKRYDVEDRKRQFSEVSSEHNSEVSQSKKKRLITINQVNIQPGFFTSVQSETSNSPTVTLNCSSLSRLVLERDNLRQEVKELQMKLSCFQQLFKDKKRLTSVVKRLGLKEL